ncbi:transducin beta-like protein 3 [Rhinichthys klamathensis goyatoka]|uniref:transducin beta-like protein 3 n=1 Tax=Rhinichthys klamathensis goyatoka TaxID=3034132 RepID=UPI0024B5D405|nr:transducin beta-like protein 3 [Rhinichthys klamathensis goyatoka]
MAGHTLLFKSNYAVSSKIEPFYKGGKVQISRDEQHIFCTCGSRVNILQINTGKIIHSIEQDDQEDITSFSLSPDDEMLVTASRALLLKQWDWKQDKCTRSWRAIHNVPVASMTFDCTSTLLATGGCDGTIKLWDVVKQYCTHNLKGSSGVVHLVEFHPDISRLQLFSSSANCGIRIWDLRSSKCICVLESHYSAVTSLAFSPDGQTLVSSGRDKICSVWDLKEKAVKRTVPVYEAVEGVVLLPGTSDYSQMGVKSEELHFVTAGSKGVLRVWDSSSARCVFTQTLPDAPDLSTEEADLDPRCLVHLLPMPQSNRLATVTAEHNILIYQMPTLTVQQQFVGYNDDILDVKFLGKDDTHIVVATNSSQLKVFELATNSCQILYGHTDTILSIDVLRKGSMFASCAKDKSLRLWKMDPNSGYVQCVAQGSGHSNAVGSIACSRLKKVFLVSGSQDCTIKVWELPDPLPAVGCEPALMTATLTEKAHDKDVNSVTISPNDKLLASGSQDRTAKLWSLADMSLLGVFRGHGRGIWCVQFSPVDQVLATASADGSIKIWSLQEFSCLKTFEGHDASVLKIIFVSRGTQLVSSGSDGLVKLWTIKTNECVKTFDAHQDKVWALHGSSNDDLMVSGSADSTITLWKDVTKVELAEEQAKQEEQVLKQQELSNLLHEKKYLKALGIAISLDQPHTALRVIREIRQQEDGMQELEKTLLKLRQDQKESVMRYCVVWNTNSRSCLDAQAILQVLLTHLSPEEMLQYQGARTHLEGLIPYTERHMQRIGRLLQASMFLDYMWQKMRITGGKESVNLDDDEMDTSPQSIIIIDKQPMEMTDTQASQQQPEDDEEEEDLEDSENSVELLDEGVSTSKSAHVNLKKPNGVNGGAEEGHVSSEESEDEDEVMEISTKSLPNKFTGSALCETATIR